ncbi:hypothetical protein GF369_02990 [Candidatus Peregrinibacteria bacterium]|nr:hypothetical protein [Candidatus Peregrinibacteria bacterium]
MKRYTIALCMIFSLIFLTGCFGSSDDAAETQLENFSVYKAPTFSISVPQQWQTIEPKDFSRDIPQETQIIFRDHIQNDIFTANANVTKRILTQPISSVEYGKSMVNENKESLLNFKEISRDEEFNIAIGGQMQKTLLVMFEGKENESEPTIRIVQTYAVNGSDAYTVTAAYRTDASELQVEEAKNIVKSFKVT